MSYVERCSYQIPMGEGTYSPCHNKAQHGSEFCYPHDPAKQEARKRAQAQAIRTAMNKKRRKNLENGERAASTNKSHGRPCSKCGVRCYSVSGECRACSRQLDPSGRFPNPCAAPEDYLMKCAEELLKRHKHRAETLAQLGLMEAA